MVDLLGSINGILLGGGMIGAGGAAAPATGGGSLGLSLGGAALLGVSSAVFINTAGNIIDEVTHVNFAATPSSGGGGTGGGSIMSDEEMIQAGEQIDKGGLTKAGRALEKHGSRSGSVFPQARGNVGAKNSQGLDILKQIVASANRATRVNNYGGYDVIDLVTGRGARFNGSNEMVGFLEPFTP